MKFINLFPSLKGSINHWNPLTLSFEINWKQGWVIFSLCLTLTKVALTMRGYHCPKRSIPTWPKLINKQLKNPPSLFTFNLLLNMGRKGKFEGKFFEQSYFGAYNYVKYEPNRILWEGMNLRFYSTVVMSWSTRSFLLVVVLLLVIIVLI